MATTTLSVAVQITNLLASYIAESAQQVGKVWQKTWVEVVNALTLTKLFYNETSNDMAALTDGTAMSATTYGTANKSITATEYGLGYTVTKKALAAQPDIIERVAKIAITAAGRKRDLLIATLAAALTTNLIDKSAGALLYSDVVKAQAKLDAQNVPEDGRILVVHPTAYSQIVQDMAANKFALETFKETSISGNLAYSVAGAELIKSNTVTVTTSVGMNYMAHKECFGLVVAGDPAVAVQEQALARAFDIGISQIVGADTVREPFGCLLKNLTTA